MTISKSYAGSTLDNAAYWTARWLFRICLIAPIACSIARKVIPSQPAAIETSAGLLIVAILGWCIISHPLPALRNLTLPIALFASIHVIYFFSALLQDWRIGATALLTRLGPLSMIVIAALAVRSFDDLKWVAKPALLIMLLQFPAAIAMLFGGNSSLPQIFQAITSLRELGRDQRMNVDAFSGIFSTPASLSTAAVSMVFVALAMSAELKKNASKIFLICASAGLVFVLYLTVRRGMFFLGCIGVFVYVLSAARKLSQKLGLIVLLVGCVYAVSLVDRSGVDEAAEVEARSDTLTSNVNFEERFGVIFFPIVGYWIDHYPLGSFLGNGGLEASAFGIERDEPVEVLAAVWVLEFGIIGAAICLLAMVMILAEIHKMSVLVLNRGSARLVLVYCTGFFFLAFFKEASAFSQITFANIMFWSIPGVLIGLLNNRRVVLLHYAGRVAASDLPVAECDA